jgi:hypothetical protein
VNHKFITGLALILIGLALLLSDVKSGAQNTEPLPKPTAKGQTEQAKRHNETTQPSCAPPQPLIPLAAIQTPPLQSPMGSPTPKGDKDESDYVGLGLAINGILATATLIVAIVGIFQARAAREAANEANQANALDQTLSETRKSTDAAVANAEAAAKQAEIADASLRATQKMLVLTHRPKVIIRNVVIKPIVGVAGPVGHGAFFWRGYSVTGQLYAVNVGDTPAHTTECGCWVIWKSFDNPPQPLMSLPMHRPYERQERQHSVDRHSSTRSIDTRQFHERRTYG